MRHHSGYFVNDDGTVTEIVPPHQEKSALLEIYLDGKKISKKLLLNICLPEIGESVDCLLKIRVSRNTDGQLTTMLEV